MQRALSAWYQVGTKAALLLVCGLGLMGAASNGLLPGVGASANAADEAAADSAVTETKPAETPATETPAAETPAAEAKPETPAAEPAAKPAETPAAETKPSTEPTPAVAAPAEPPKAKELVIHLDNPSGIAVHPGTGHIFVVSRQGVFRTVPGKPTKVYLEVEGFGTDIYGKGPKYNIGPLGCCLWGTDRLIVADGSRPDGEEVVRIYKIEDKLPGPPRKEVDAEFTLGPIAPGELSPKGEGNFYGVVVHNDAIFVTANGDDTKGWIAKSTIADGKPGPLVPSLATKEAVQVDAPVPITTTPDGKELVVGQMGEVNAPGDSLLTFYNPADGKLIRSLKTGLHDLTGLAYGPTGKLYATDFAWVDPSQGGVFELVIEGEEVKPRKIIGLDRPTAIAFDKEGNMLVTVFGVGRDMADKPSGGLLKFASGSF